MSFNYPVSPDAKQRRQYAAYIRSMGNVLPCGTCRQNYADNLCAAGFGPAVLRDRDSFSRFVYRLHDEVNKLLGKKSPTFESVRDLYEGFRAKCKHTPGSHEGCIEPETHRRKARCRLLIVARGHRGKTLSVE
jgi:hypothetical protein